jgi:hypothetical protein
MSKHEWPVGSEDYNQMYGQTEAQVKTSDEEVATKPRGRPKKEKEEVVEESDEEVK